MNPLAGIALALLAFPQDAPVDTLVVDAGTRLEADPVYESATDPAQVTADSSLLPATWVAARVREALNGDPDVPLSELLAAFDTAAAAPTRDTGAAPSTPPDPSGDATALPSTEAAEEPGSRSSMLTTATARTRAVASTIADGVRAAGLGETRVRFALWVGLSLLAILVVPRLLSGGTARPMRRNRTPVHKRVGTARHLAGRGRPMADIARETRLAREALTLLMRAESRS